VCHQSILRLLQFGLGQYRLAEAHPLNALELAQDAIKVLSCYFQRPSSGSLGSFCKITFCCRPGWRGRTTLASMRLQPFRHHLPYRRKHGCCWKRGLGEFLRGPLRARPHTKIVCKPHARYAYQNDRPYDNEPFLNDSAD
jgi:hypothetical protein